MQRKFPHLSSPIKIGNLTLQNRMISAPMAYPNSTKTGYVMWEEAAFYESRAKGGAAVVTMSEGIVHWATGKSHTTHINLDDEGALTMLAESARSIKRHGALACIELNHSGMHSAVDTLGAARESVKYGPSEMELSDGTRIYEMPKALMHEIISSFGKSAALVKRAGFDMLLVHGGHGWLIHQFLSPAANRRTDEYGGSVKKRARLALEILDSIRTAVGPGFPIEFRLSAEEYGEGGYELPEAIEIAKLIQGKIDLLQVSTGGHENSFGRTHPSMFVPRGVNVHYAAEIKKHVKVPVATIGALCYPEQMEEIIASGKVDVVELGRALLADPELPRKAVQGREDEIVKCIRCFACMSERIHTKTRICALNPTLGREWERREPKKTDFPKKVLVAGGGPGGMEAAITAAKCGHKVILCEKTGRLGGAVLCESEIPFKQDLHALVKTKSGELRRAGVDVRLETEVTPEYVESEAPDVLIVAVGARPIKPPIPGIDSEKVVLGNDICSGEAEFGRKVVVLGGGLVGCECAVYLAQQVKDVTVVEMLSEVAADANTRHRQMLLEMLDSLVRIETGLTGIRISEDGIYCRDKNGEERFFEADTVLCAVGQRPLYEVVDSLRDSAPAVELVGDCIKPGNVRNAVWRGYHAGLDI